MNNIASTIQFLDGLTVKVRNDTSHSKDWGKGANYAIQEVIKRFKLEQCPECLRIFKSLKGLQGHKNRHIKFVSQQRKEGRE